MPSSYSGFTGVKGETGPQGPDGASPPPALTVAASRDLADSDNGRVLEVTADPISLTIPASLAAGFAVIIIPNGTTSIVSSGGTLLNGATTTLTRSNTSNRTFGIIQLPSAANSYLVQGY